MKPLTSLLALVVILAASGAANAVPTAGFLNARAHPPLVRVTWFGENACIACQNECYRRAEWNKWWCNLTSRPASKCEARWSDYYGNCKVRCKGSSACLRRR